MKKVSIVKLDEAGLLNPSYHRYRSIVAYFKKERRKGVSKTQAVMNTSIAKGATERTVYNAIKVCSKL